MKWKQLIKDLNLFFSYEPDINLTSTKKILSILFENMSEVKRNQYSTEFNLLQQYTNKQTSLTKRYDIKKLRSNISKIKGDTN